VPLRRPTPRTGSGASLGVALHAPEFFTFLVKSKRCDGEIKEALRNASALMTPPLGKVSLDVRAIARAKGMRVSAFFSLPSQAAPQSLAWLSLCVMLSTAQMRCGRPPTSLRRIRWEPKTARYRGKSNVLA
jgi:hypothetical protein